MRHFINLVESALAEDDFHDRTKTKDPTLDLHLEPAASKGELSTSTRSDTAPVLPGKKSGKKKTTASIKGITDPRAGEMMGSLVGSGLEDEISDEEARRRAGVDSIDTGEPRPTPENLPAIIIKAIAETGQGFEPNWHMVKHLPGYMQSAIRALGRQVFAPFTNTPIEDIQVLSTLSNDENEVKAMMAWIRKNGVRDDQAELKFERVLPGYHADVQIWSTRGYTFMLVRDFGGYYVYSWPGGRGVHVGAATTRRIGSSMDTRHG